MKWEEEGKIKTLYSEAAVNLMLGTALAESDLHNLLQIGGGPGLGLFQPEPTTLDDTFYRYLGRPDKSGLMEAVQPFVTEQDVREQMIGNIPFALIIARLKYWMVPEPLPEYDDVQALAEYWKRHYNTQKGSGEVVDFVSKYKIHVLGIRP